MVKWNINVNIICLLENVMLIKHLKHFQPTDKFNKKGNRLLVILEHLNLYPVYICPKIVSVCRCVPPDRLKQFPLSKWLQDFLNVSLSRHWASCHVNDESPLSASFISFDFISQEHNYLVFTSFLIKQDYVPLHVTIYSLI